MSSFEHCEIEKENDRIWIFINRPASLNALTKEASFELAQILDEYESDSTLKAAIISGKGSKAFCTGNDLNHTAQGNSIEIPASGFGGITHRTTLFKPVIAAVNGYALGGGFEIALACDFIIASENAQFGLPEAKVGLGAFSGGIHRLVREAGLKNALSMLMTGRFITAHEAHRMGIICDVTTQDNLIKTTNEWVDMILECSPAAVQAAKETALQGLNTSDPIKAIQQTEHIMQELLKNPDAKEGPLAFIEKRRPKWSD